MQCRVFSGSARREGVRVSAGSVGSTSRAADAGDEEDRVETEHVFGSLQLLRARTLGRKFEELPQFCFRLTCLPDSAGASSSAKCRTCGLNTQSVQCIVAAF